MKHQILPSNFDKITWVIAIIISLLLPFSLHAQKFPNKQTKSLWLPADLKIDGKAAEWGDQLQAYNRATGVFYTIANDDNNLYFIFQVSDIDVLTKLIGKGICVKVRSIEKNDKDEKTITYPYFDKSNRPYLNFKQFSDIPSNSLSTQKRTDSIMRFFNKTLDEKSKEIKVFGITGLDTLISVYNDYGIKVRGAFDKKIKYTCELEIPLKYWGIALQDNPKFSYQVIIAGLDYTNFGITAGIGPDGIPTLSVADGAGAAIPKKNHLAGIYSTTDFWGEYTLAKKP